MARRNIPRYTPEELQAIIDRFFEQCKGRVLTNQDGDVMYDKYGRPIVVDNHPPTTTGLARACGFKSLDEMFNYRSRTGTQQIVSDAIMRIQEYAEGRLYDRDGVNGAKFVLQNRFEGWDRAMLAKAEAGAPVVNIIADIPRPVRVAETDEDEGEENADS